MNHLDIDILERLAGEPSSLTAAATEAARVHLRSCTGCRESLNWLEQFHIECREAENIVQGVVLRFVGRLFPMPRVVVLHRIPRDVRSQDSGPRPVVLAAATPQAPQTYELCNALASSTGDDLIRMMEDKDRKTVTVYLHSRQPSDRGYAIISFPEIHAHMALGPGGSMDIPDTDPLRKKLPTVRQAIVHYPCGQCTADLQGGTCSVPLETGYQVGLRRSGKTVAFNVIPVRQDVPPAAFLSLAFSTGQTTLVHLDDGTGEAACEESKCLVRLYA